MIRLLYFAWVRERIGTGEETIEIPGELSLSELVGLLAGRSPGHAAALADRARLRAAVNHEFAAWDARVAPGDEVAIFPPVTGG
ncbi:MAG: molybdopterin converting factor subunit 1 [Sphingomonadaceae bacterium]|uniref:molybdopterin converting factor subunit 1 n=1 Tax=Thermaurantiacus sp. TaxID=2820283 RepID=UPI00298F102E|nr:molybdopterin converting factor subunit 1 [Thermaurantiacus sp.]MCS6985848.1 molybdopterin converting factor subunit 1 [Sphingomonadaceae bacterium]MDW8413883.1 molybdopterin converting factor subunit 1 [Thermaurantiacus sp.]